MPNAPWAAITVAPVWPALNSAAASPRATRFGRDGNRRAWLPAQRRGRRVLHRHDIGRVDDADAAAIDVAVTRELGLDASRPARPASRRDRNAVPRRARHRRRDAARNRRPWRRRRSRSLIRGSGSGFSQGSRFTVQGWFGSGFGQGSVQRCSGSGSVPSPEPNPEPEPTLNPEPEP